MESPFRKFRSKQGEVWQLGSYEIPLWSIPEEEERRPFRPRMAACWSVRTGRMQTAGHETGDPGPELFRKVVARAAGAWRLRPVRIEVADAWLAEDLGVFLADEDVEVAVRAEMPELRAALEERTRDLRALLSPAPGALSGPGVTVERLAAFARAVVRFVEAAPWRHLSPVDFLVLASDGLPDDLRWAQVVGPPIRGIGFHATKPEEDADGWDDPDDSEEDRDDDSREAGTGRPGIFTDGLWTVSVRAPLLVPSEDVELWNRHDLPLADPRAYPMALRYQSGSLERPDVRLLAWFEAVLAALAETTEEEMDSGRWVKDGMTAEGPVRLEISLPGVLEPPFADDAGDDAGEPPTPEKLAESLAREAEDTLGRRQVHLARRAVALWPGCVDAWLVLARRAPDRETARDLYARAVAAAEPRLPKAVPRRGWLLPNMEDRRDIMPYLFARIGLAKALWDLGDREEAAGHFQGILAVDPDDSERVVYLLAHALLALGRDDEAGDLLARYAENRADWHYTQALLTFRHAGDNPIAHRHLAAALRSDRDVAEQLLNHWPADRNHDAEDVDIYRDVWTDTPGALAWLRSQSKAASTAGQARKRKRKDKKNRKRRGR